MSLIVMSLGELERDQVEAAIERSFGGLGHDVCWFDRGALRRLPIWTLVGLWRRRFDRAVLVVPELGQPRLRLTSFLLGLARARGHWRIDVRGGCERWSLAEHLARNGAAILRHAVACALALWLSEALLEAIARATRPRQLRAARPRRMLYLRSQLWLGLRGGGSVAHTAGVIGGLQELGVEVRVVSSDRLPGVRAKTLVVAPEMWFDGWLRELEDLAYNVAFGLAAWRTASRFRPQAIYQRHTAFNVAGAVLSRLLKVPLVLEYNSSEVWKGRHWGGLRLERAAQRVERINLRAADRVVVVSRVLRDEVMASGVAPERVVINPNGVDPRVFRSDAGGSDVRRALGLEWNVVVGFSGTFGAWHGIPTLAAAVPLVLAARPNVRWLVIGDGALRSAFDRDVGPDERVVRVGMLPHSDMPGYLAACDVLISPHGRQADGGEFFGSPTKLYEYMAAGKAIVASQVGQIGEVLCDGRTALLVDPEDAPALARAIVRLVDDSELRARIGAAARREAEVSHTWRQNAERVLGALSGE